MMNSHDPVWKLLPWYVNGTLNEGEMAAVSRHLSSCASCQAEVDEEMRRLRSLHERNPQRLNTMLSKEQDSFEQLLESLPERPRSRRRIFWQPALAAAVAVAAGLMLVVLAPPVPDPETLPSDTVFGVQTSTGLMSQTPVVQVIFHPETPEQDIRTFLIESGSELLGNPSPQGVYRIAIGGTNVDEAMVQVRGHPAVRWAEREL
jgi:hypothetical protein